MICPNQSCARDIPPGEVDWHKSRTKDPNGLRPIRCPQCGHAGFIAGEGLHLVFRAGQDYCFTFGSLPAHLTVSLTAEVMYAYQWAGLGQEALARHAAEWLLLLGHNSGVFNLSPDRLSFEGFTRYLQSQALPKFRPHIA